MKNKKTLVVILIVIVTFLGIVAFQQQAQQRPQPQQQQDDPPTPIQLGVMSEKQKRHSKLYTQRRGKKDLVSKGGNVNFVYNIPWVFENPNRVSFLQFLSERKCSSDVIVIGEAVSKASQLTENSNFVFTDYEIGVQDVLYNKQSLSLSPNMTITLTRAGGAVLLGNRIISVRDRIFKPLRIGKQYLLFLKVLPDTNSFISLDSRSSFELSNNRAIPLTDENLNFTEDYNLVETINQLRNSPNCQTQGGI